MTRQFCVILTEEELAWLELHIPYGAVTLHDSETCDGIHNAIANAQETFPLD